MSQPQPRQQHEFPDIQMLQRQIMFKQLQELQRQRQLQQIGDLRQQNYMNQVSLFNKQTSGIQLPPIVNGTPVRDTSHIFSTGNMQLMQRGSSTADHEFPNGSIFSQCQSQASSPMGGLPHHQLNMSIYGSPVVGTGNSLNPYSTLQGLSNDTTSTLTNINNIQLERPMFQHATFNSSFMSGQSNASSGVSGNVFMSDIVPALKQVLQGKNFSGQVPIQSLDGLLAGNSQQESTLPRKSSMLESCSGQEHVNWSGLSAQKLPNMGNSQSSCSLDPLEHKILFNTDDSWEPNLSEHSNVGISGFGSTSGNSDCMSSFPTIQSGSWSALMQSAVAEASSCDTGLQEEWSGLSFQNPELSTENQPSSYVDSGRQQSNGIDNNMQNASSPSSKLELVNQIYSMNCNSQGLQRLNHQFPGEEEIHSDSSQYVGKRLDSSPQQKQPMKEIQLVQIASPGQRFWPSQNEHTEHTTHPLNLDCARSCSNRTGKSGEVNTEVNGDKSPLNTISAVPDMNTTEVKQIVGHETDQHISNSTNNIMIERIGNHHPPRSECLGKEKYIESNQSNAAHVLRGKSWLHGITHLPLVDSQQKPSNQAQLTHQPHNSIAPGDSDGPMPTLLDTSCFLGQNVATDTSKHLLNQFHMDGKFVEHGTGTHYKCKEFVQTSEKIQMRASEASQWIPRLHTYPASLHLLYSQPQNPNLPLHVASHSPQEMFASQGTTPSLARGICKEVSLVTHANLHGQAEHSMLPEDPQHPQFQLGFHKVSSNLFQPTASTTSSLDHTPRTSEEQHNQSLFREGNDSEVIDSSFQKPQAFDSYQRGLNKPYPPSPSARDLESFGHSRPPQVLHKNYSLHKVQSLMNVESLAIKRSKKRKLGTFHSMPWYKEVTQSSLKCLDFSMTELEWCLASNRSKERVENEAEVENSAPIYRSKRRLTKTTQLMQQIFRPAPAVIVSADAFDSVVYFVSRLVLGDACNMTSDFNMQTTADDMPYDKVDSPGVLCGKDLFKNMENFICRVDRLEADFMRLEKRASIFDLKVESQEMEKYSTINRFARFHSGGIVASSSTATPVVLNSAPQRYIMVFPMPKTVPVGERCLSL